MALDEVRLGTRTLQPRRQLLARGERVPIGKRALDILSVLAEARGGIVTKDELLEAVWPGIVVEENALQVHIVALRKALGPDAGRLRTIRGVGYQLEFDGTEPRLPSESVRYPTPGGSGPKTGPMWTKLQLYRVSGALAVLLLVLAGTWAIFGSEFGLRPQGRVSVVVRELTATTIGSPTEAALASGITDELIIRLRRIPELRIASAYADGTVPRGEFGNAYMVDGSIRRSGEHVRVTARLSSASGEVLWSQTFDRQFAELFDIQEQIAAAIANALSVSFDIGIDSTEYGGTSNPEAFAAYMQYVVRASDPAVTPALAERAVALDPDYIKAHVALVIAYGVRAQFSPPREAAEFLAKMDKSSARALSANPNLPIGHYARGWYLLFRKDIPAADREMRRAAELDQGDDLAMRFWLGGYDICVGRIRKGDLLIQSTAAIDPIVKDNAERVRDLVLLGQYADAIAMYGRLSPEDRENTTNKFHTFWAYLLSQGDAKAAEFDQQVRTSFVAERRAFEADRSLLTMSLPQLRQWAERRGTSGQFPMVNYALWAARDGHPRLAVDLMRVGLERLGGYQLYKLWHPAFAPARKTDEFEQLVTELGLVRMWRESGDWGDFCRPVSANEFSCT